ncbi:MAG: hypothetical protein GX550_03325 [Syntrophomonadaceae bacterium]|nr:hypothetical protein [Syntrophomonadaceae bacterium]
MSDNRRFVVKFEGPAITNHSLSFKTLANVLDGIQNTFYYIGMEITKREKARGRIPDEIQQACELRRVMERSGSYEVVAELSSPMQSGLFTGLDLGKEALDKYFQMTDWLSGGKDEANIRQLFPEEKHRRRILKSVQKYSPRKGDDWVLVFQDPGGNRQYGFLDHQTVNRIDRAVSAPQYETSTMFGQLVKIDFEQHKITIRHESTGKSLDCTYNPEDEDTIITNRDGYLMISGVIELDTSGNPNKIASVTDIRYLDLSPVRLSRIATEAGSIELKKAIVIQPVFENQEIVLNYEDLNIIAVGEDREQAIRDFEDDFVWLWREYVLVEDHILSEDAKHLKKNLQELVRRANIES